MTMKFRSSLALVLAVGLMLACGIGCRHNVNTANPQVVRAAALLDASNATVTVEDGLTAANKTISQLETAEPEYYAHVRPLLKKISAANVVAARKIQAAKNGDTSADWRGPLIAVAQTVQPSDLVSFGFKNPNSQLLVQSGFATLVGILTEIPQKFGGAQ